MFNKNHYFEKKDGFCSTNVNKLINRQVWIWVFLFFFFFNNLPLIVFWLKGGPKLARRSGRRTGYIDIENQGNYVEDLKRVKLFCVTSTIFEYYPWVGSLYHFLFEKRYSKVIWVGIPFLFFYYFHMSWFFIADFLYKNTEFRQRSNMSNGTDDYLEPVELVFASIRNCNSRSYLYSVLYSFLINFPLFYVIIGTSAWAHNTQFLMLKIKCQDPNLQFNCIHRQMLLCNLSFWKAFWGSLILSEEWNICIRVLAAIPCIILLTLIAVVLIMFPLLDIILHHPFGVFKYLPFIILKIVKRLFFCRPILKILPFCRTIFRLLHNCIIFLDDEKDESDTCTVNTGVLHIYKM